MRACERACARMHARVNAFSSSHSPPPLPNHIHSPFFTSLSTFTDYPRARIELCTYEICSSRPPGVGGPIGGDYGVEPSARCRRTGHRQAAAPLVRAKATAPACGFSSSSSSSPCCLPRSSNMASRDGGGRQRRLKSLRGSLRWRLSRTDTIESESSRDNYKPILLFIVLVVCLAVALTVGLVVNFRGTTGHQGQEEKAPRTGVLVDCHPDKGASKESCEKRGCTWQPQEEAGAPWCIFTQGHGYRQVGRRDTTLGVEVTLERQNSSQLYNSTVVQRLKLSVEFHSPYRLRLKFSPDGNSSPYEIPSNLLDIPSPTSKTPDAGRLYDVTFTETPQFGIIVTRRSTNTTIFNSSLPGMEVSEQFLQLPTQLATDWLYGFGEHNHHSLKHTMAWKTYAMFTRDAGANDPWNLYGHQPVYMNLEEDGSAHMVFLKNSNAQEVALQPAPFPAVTWRAVGGVLDFYLFLGPTPIQAVQQYTEAVGRPVMPPYWSLGFHLCRWGYLDLEDMVKVINRTRAAGIPYDGQWADIEHMHKYYAFTYDHKDWADLPHVIQDLHDHHQKFVIINDPGVGADPTIIAEIQQTMPAFNMFEDGKAQGVLINDSNGDVLIGEVWPGITAYPDFTNPSTEAWWLKWMSYLHQNLSIEFDALWIDMNEPSSFVPGSKKDCPKNNWEYPPYAPNVLGAQGDGRMFDKTICMSATQHLGRHYDLHSLYAHTESMQTYSALKALLPGKRPWTMTRSSFAGTGKYATKWMGDNLSRWDNLKFSIIGLLEFSMFGFAMNGADICGFWGEADREMCIRWHQLGAFYPFARNHNAKGDQSIFRHQDPAAWDDVFVAATRHVLLIRYKFLPYFYTQLFLAHTQGATLATPLFFHFPQDKIARQVDEQFLLGPAMLISPVLRANNETVHAYFPDARWFNYFTGVEVEEKGEYRNLLTPLEKFNLHLRGGYILPWQEPATTTYESRMNPFGLLVALDDSYKASGELFWDSGEEDLANLTTAKYLRVHFRMPTAGRLELTPEVTRYPDTGNVTLRTIDIYGLDKIPNAVMVDGNRLEDTNVRQVTSFHQLLDLSLSLKEKHVITWIDS